MFNPNFITKLVTTLAILPISLVNVQPANAGLQDMTCGQIQDAGTWCGEYLGEYGGGTAYRIEYTNPNWNEKETMTVICDRRNVIDWESNGNLTQGQADWVAEEFCALPSA